MDADTVLQTVQLLLVDWIERIDTPAPWRIDVYMKSEDLLPAVAGLRVKRLGYLVAITGLDPAVDCQELEILYHFSVGAIVITLRVRVDKQSGSVESLSEIIPSAEPFERELREMFGVNVVGLKNPNYLYLPDGWPAGVFPMRKDVTLTPKHQAIV